MEVGLERSRLGIKCTCSCADSSPLKLGSGRCLTNSGNIKAECSPPTATALQLPLQGDMKQRRNLQLEQNQHTRRWERKQVHIILHLQFAPANEVCLYEILSELLLSHAPCWMKSPWCSRNGEVTWAVNTLIGTITLFTREEKATRVFMETYGKMQEFVSRHSSISGNWCVTTEAPVFSAAFPHLCWISGYLFVCTPLWQPHSTKPHSRVLNEDRKLHVQRWKSPLLCMGAGGSTEHPRLGSTCSVSDFTFSVRFWHYWKVK